MPDRLENVIIRLATAADAPGVARLSAQLGYPADTAAFTRRLEKLITAPDAQVFVAERAGEIVGWAHVERRLLVESAEFAEIGGLVVDGALRRQGIGGHLVTACRAWSQARGLSRLRVRTNVVREEAHRFYERQGFVHLKSQAVFSLECV